MISGDDRDSFIEIVRKHGRVEAIHLLGEIWQEWVDRNKDQHDDWPEPLELHKTVALQLLNLAHRTHNAIQELHRQTDCGRAGEH